MSRIFITGSADGLGLMAAKLLIAGGHQVVLHARNEQRANEAHKAATGAETTLAADLSSIAETKALADKVNRLGQFDAVIHNAGVGYREPKRIVTIDGLPHVFAVNSLAPYILTSLINKPQRLIYLSSALHREGDPSLKDLTWENRRWNGYHAYADSKLHDVLLAFATARLWPGQISNALEPGWVATKMGGKGASDSLEDGPKTQVWLATSNDPEALLTGKYYYHLQQRQVLGAAKDSRIQDQFIAECARLSGIAFPKFHSAPLTSIGSV